MLASCLVTGCTTSKPIAATLIIDKSESALKDEQFAKIAIESCHSVAKGLLASDFAQQITVNGTAPRASDLSQILDPRIYHRDCEKSPDAALVSTTPQGTFSCPAWDLAFDLSHRQSVASLPVLYVSIIQTNELETACPQTWQQLAEDADKRGGKLLIVGSSVGEQGNPALNNSFNQLLWQHLKDSPSTVFCEETNVQGCIEQAYIDLRQPTGGER
jgi:hypothetical protein